MSLVRIPPGSPPSSLARLAQVLWVLGGAVWTGAGCAPSATPPSQRQAPAEQTAEVDESQNVLPPQSEPAVNSLFDGKNLTHWERTNFGGEGEVEVVDGAIILQRGQDQTGVHWTGDPLPKINYEVTLEAQRIEGSDFFCCIVFPVKDEYCSFVAGGWGGSTIGLSSVDGMYAAENETGTYANFEEKKWYKVRLRVTDSAILAWIDGKEYVNLRTKNRKFSVHPAVEVSKPFGLSCYACVAGLREIELRALTEEEIAASAAEAAE